MLLFQVSYKEEWPSRNVQSSMLWQKKEREGEDPEWIYIQYMSEKVPINGMFNETPFCVNEINIGGGGHEIKHLSIFYCSSFVLCVYHSRRNFVYTFNCSSRDTSFQKLFQVYTHNFGQMCAVYGAVLISGV